MKGQFLKLAAVAGLAAGFSLPASAGTTTYQIDPRHSSANFAVTHLMISTVRGEFHGVNGSIVVDDSNIRNSSVNVTIDATTVVVLTATAPKPTIKDPWGLQRTATSATTKVNRQDFGVSWNQKLDGGGVVVGDEVNITLDVEMVVPPAGK